MNNLALRPFRPMAELDHTNPVEFQLTSRSFVTGWMITGITSPASHTYVYREFGESKLCNPTGWREIEFWPQPMTGRAA